MSEDTKTPPADRVRLGTIGAAIWRNQSGERTWFNVTFERRYRDRAGEWQSSTSFDREDLLTLAKIADLAHTRIHELEADERSAVSDAA